MTAVAYQHTRIIETHFFTNLTYVNIICIEPGPMQVPAAIDNVPLQRSELHTHAVQEDGIIA